MLGGAFADPADGAALVFKADSEDVVKRFADSDPYVRAGLVTEWRIRSWTTVVGDSASSPVLPS
jgi:uncharacterized protein YciI